MGIATVNTESQGAVSTTSGSSGGVCMGGVLARRCRRPICVGLLDILMTFTREVRFARHLEEWSCIRSPQRIYPANVAAVGSTPLCRAGGCTSHGCRPRSDPGPCLFARGGRIPGEICRGKTAPSVVQRHPGGTYELERGLAMGNCHCRRSPRGAHRSLLFDPIFHV